MRRLREEREPLPEARELGAARRATAQVPADPRFLRLRQRGEQVVQELVANLGAAHGSASRSADIASRSRSSAAWIRVFAVPSGIPSISATSAVVRPPK